MKLVRKILMKIRGEPDIEKLKKRGLKIGRDFKMMGGCIIDPSHCWHIEIGNNVTLAPGVHILAHDASTKIFLGYTRIANVKIGDNIFIGAGSIILPGVSIGNNVIIGAGSVVTGNIPDNTVAAGIPAKPISSLKEYIEKEKADMHEKNCFDRSHTLRSKDFGEQQRLELLSAVKEYKKVFVV